MRPVNGLFLLRLIAAPPRDPAKAAADTVSEEPTKNELTTSAATEQLKLVCRLRFHGARAGGVSGSVRVIGYRRNDNHVPRATLTNDGAWSVDADGAISVAFTIQIDRIEGDVVGGTTSELIPNVSLSFPGTMASRTFVGAVSVYSPSLGFISKSPENGLRGVMTEFSTPRCVKCHDPVEFGRSPCTAAVGSFEYCSSTCKDAHAPLLDSVSTAIGRYTGPNASRCTASYGGVEFAVYWASAASGASALATTAFTILVDATNPVGIAYEMRIDVLIDARVGTAMAFIGPEAASKKLPSESEVLCQNYSVFEAVIQSAVQCGCGALAAACLNQLYRWCDYVEFVERLYLYYYDMCIGSGWEGQRVISTLGEYMTLVRPMYEGSTVLVEAALKSITPADFWFRLENAKGILVTLYNLNGSINFTPAAQPLRTLLVPEQQRQTLLLLARVFIIMAARTGKAYAPKMLKRAEECYRDALDEDKCRNNFRRMGYSCTQLAALYLMFPDADERAKAEATREQGLVYLAQSLRNSNAPDANASAIQAVVGMVQEQLTRGGGPPAAPASPGTPTSTGAPQSMPPSAA